MRFARPDGRSPPGPRASHRSAPAKGTNQASGTVQTLARMCSLASGPGGPSSVSRARRGHRLVLVAGRDQARQRRARVREHPAVGQLAAQPGLPRADIGDAVRPADVGVLALLVGHHELGGRDGPAAGPRPARRRASRAASAGPAKRRRPPTWNGPARGTPRPARRSGDTRRKSSLSYRDIPERRKDGALGNKIISTVSYRSVRKAAGRSARPTGPPQAIRLFPIPVQPGSGTG